MDESFGKEEEDDDDLDATEEEEPTFLEKDLLLFLIDARSRMMQPTGSTAEPPFIQALDAVATSMRSRVIAGDSDLVGVMLFGTQHASAPENLEPAANTYLLLPLEVPSASSIERLQTLNASRDFSEFGHMDESEPFDMARVFWQRTVTTSPPFDMARAIWQLQPHSSSNSFLLASRTRWMVRLSSEASYLCNQCPGNQSMRKRVFILTNDDRPCDTPEAIQHAEQRARDFGGARVIVEPFLFPPPAPPGGGPAPALDLGEGSFWAGVISAARSALPPALTDNPADAIDAAEAGGALTDAGALTPANWVCADASRLEARLVRAQHRRRPYATLEFRLGPVGAPTLCVKMVTVVAPFSRPTATKLHSADNEVLVMEKCTISITDGSIITKDDLYKTFNFGGKMLYFDPSDVSTSRVASELLSPDEPPLLLLGFRPLDALKPYLNMRNSTFLEPSDRAPGTITHMQALVDAMVKKQRFALARYRKSGAPSLVALLPQQREEDPLSGLVRLPYGMHMIYLPFADALRFPDLPEALAESTFTDNQRTATKRMIEELTLPSAGAGVLGALRNPAAEAHYRALEAAAFTHTDFSALQPIIDTTLPDAEWLGQPERVEAVDSFFKSFGLSGEPMAAAGASDRQPKRQKLSVPQTEDEWMKAHREEKLGDLTAAVLKEKCREAKLPLSGKKEELVARVSKYLHDKALEQLNM